MGVSAGVEDDASFAGLAAVRMVPVVEAYRRMVAVELACAVGALHVRGVELTGHLREVFDRSAALPAGLDDHDLLPDFAIAEELVDEPSGWGYSSRAGS